jgi:hypothetical protein
MIEVVHELADQDAAEALTDAAQPLAESAQARACRQQRRLRIAARLRLHRRAQIIRQARSASLADARPPPAGVRDHGRVNDILPMPDMGE